jgi:hypothetical protein
MAEVFVEVEAPVVAEDGRHYHARVCGAEARDGTRRWEGWIEFVPAAGGRVLRTGRETTQPNRTDALYWATGLTAVYLEGALARALRPPAPPPQSVQSMPAFDGPAPPQAAAVDHLPPVVLNPLSVYEKGEPLLRSQLAALAPRHLVNIIQAYGFSAEAPAALLGWSLADLVELIVAGVRRQKIRA